MELIKNIIISWNKHKDIKILSGIMLVVLIFRVIYFVFLFPDSIYYNSDSVTYHTPNIIDLYRTPIYPVLINIFEFFSKENYISNLLIFQQIISFLSIIPFYYTAKKLIKKNIPVVLTTLFYGCWYYLLDNNVNINPECLSIVGSVSILYIFVKHIEKPTKLNSFLLGLCTLFLIMTKPTYLILQAVLFVYIIIKKIFYKERNSIFLYASFGWLVSLSGILLFAGANQKYNNEFTVSKIALNNHLANIVLSGTYKLGDDKELISIIDTTYQRGFYSSIFLINNDCIDSYKRCAKRFPGYLKPTHDMIFAKEFQDIDNYSFERIDNFLHKSQYNLKYFKYIFTRLRYIVQTYYYLSIIFFIESLLIFYYFFKQKKIAWGLVFCIAFVGSQFFTLGVGAIYDWNRLLVPSYPFIIILCGVFLNIGFAFVKREKLSEFLV